MLAALATVGYRRYVGRSRLTEGVTLLAEMASKQQVYFLEFGAYLPLRTDGIALPSPNEDVDGLLPVEPERGRLRVGAHGRPSPTPPAGPPPGVRSACGRASSVCIARTCSTPAARATAAPAGPPTPPRCWAPSPPPAPPGSTVLAACNLNGAAGWPNAVTVLGVSSNRSALRTFNDGQ